MENHSSRVPFWIKVLSSFITSVICVIVVYGVAVYFTTSDESLPIWKAFVVVILGWLSILLMMTINKVIRSR